MATLLPPPADFGFVDARAFLRVLRSSRKVHQGRFNKIFRHDEPSGLRTWIGGPPFAVRPESLTVMNVLAHDATVSARVVARDAPEPPSAAWLRVTAEIDGMPLLVEIPHTRAAATTLLPIEVPLALSGSIVEPAQWYRDAEHFASRQLASQQLASRQFDAEGRSVGDSLEAVPRASQSLIDPRLFGVVAAYPRVSGIVDSTEQLTSRLSGELTVVRLRTAFDIPIVVWCVATDDPPPPGAVFDGTVAICGSCPTLE